MAQLGQTLTNLQNYNDEINDPVISTVGHTGQYSDLIGAPALAPVAYTGNYNSLNGTPNLAPVATTGSYNSLSGQPSYSTVANTGNYTDLVGAPVTPVFYSNLTPAQLGIVTAPTTPAGGSSQGYTIMQQNIGLFTCQGGCAATTTTYSVPHNLRKLNNNEIMIPFAMVAMPSNQYTFLTTIAGYDSTDIYVNVVKENMTTNDGYNPVGVTYTTHDIAFSWMAYIASYNDPVTNVTRGSTGNQALTYNS